MQERKPIRFALNREFAVSPCTFRHQSRGVVFSPFTCEAILCDISVVELLDRLTIAEDITDEIDSYVQQQPISAADVIKQLVAMQILLPS